MLYEDHVVDAVRDHLKALGWTIESVAYAHQRGDDIVASNGQRTLRVEAKGGGSSKAGTNRFNKPFTLGQCKVSASKATFRAFGVVSAGDEGAVAFPDAANYRRVMTPVLRALKREGITVFLVGEDREVVTLSIDSRTQAHAADGQRVTRSRYHSENRRSARAEVS